VADDLLIRVDAQISDFEAKFGAATTSTLRFEKALASASRQQALLEAQINKYGKDSAQATTAASRAAAANARLVEQQQQRIIAMHRTMQQVGRGMVLTGGAIAVGLGLAAKAAIDWESAFAGVRKTVEGTPEQLAQVEDGLRGLATTMPTTHQELAAIAESAGALGISTPNIVEFTKTIAMLGETTNLVGDEGATALARFLNIMGTSQAEVGNTAAALVALGNAGASTESEIIALGLRLAAAGEMAGLTEGEVLGLSNAMSSLGIPAESGGTAVSMAFQQMSKAVADGGEKLKAFADVAGLSAQEFTEQFGDNAVATFNKFLDGLNGINASGGNVYKTLESIGITGQRQIDVLTRLAARTDMVTASLQQGNDAYADGTALVEEFAKRAETTAAQMEIARNNVNDLGISLGENLLPVLGDAASSITGLVDGLNNMSGPTKAIVTSLAAAAAGVGLFGGAAILAKVKIEQLKMSIAELNAAGAGISKGMLAWRTGLGAAGIGLAALNTQVGEAGDGVSNLLTVASGAAMGATFGPWGAAIGGAVGLLTTLGNSADDAKVSVQDMRNALDQTTGAITEQNRILAAQDLAPFADQLREAGVSAGLAVDAYLGNADALAELRTQLGLAEQATRDYNTNASYVVGATEEQSSGFGDLFGVIESGSGVVADAQSELHFMSAAMDGSTSSTVDNTGAVDANTDALGMNIDQMRKRRAEALRAQNAELNWQQSLLDAKAAAKENNNVLARNGELLKGQKQAGIDAKTALNGIIGAFNDLSQAEKNNKQTRRETIQTFVEAATQMGMSEAAARDYAKSLMEIPTNRKTKVELASESAMAELRAYRDELARLDGAVASTTILQIVRTSRPQGQQGAEQTAYASGGFTGQGPKYEPAGIVHRSEFVFDKESTANIGVGNLYALMRGARGYASGGVVGSAVPANGGSDGGRSAVMSMADLLRWLSRPEPVTTLRDVNRLMEARNQEEDEYKAQLAKVRDIRKEVRKIEADDGASKKQQRDAAKRLEAAEKDLNRERDEATKANDKYKESLADLRDTARGFADQARALADPFGGEGTSLTAQGFLSKQRSATQQTREFTQGLSQLRKMGLDKDVIAQLRAQGPTQEALALVNDLTSQNRGFIRQVNRADNAMNRAANRYGAWGLGGGAGGGRQAPLVTVGTMVAVDTDKAVKKLGDRVARAARKARR